MPTDALVSKKRSWRFDAIDLRAGLGFASWREDLGHASAPEEAQILHIAPPSFSPEPVGNIALALGATRGSFQAGLFIGDREATFQTPEEIAEFLRRAYVSGGGGDGADGNGGDEPAPPQPDGGSPPDIGDPEPSGGGDLDGDNPNASLVLAHRSREINQITNRLEAGASMTTSWQELSSTGAVTPLRDGATHVFEELLLRQPSRYSHQAEHQCRWQRDFGLWCTVCDHLRLWPLLIDRRGGRLRRFATAWISSRFPPLPFPLDELTFPELLSLLECWPPELDAWHELLYASRVRRHYGAFAWPVATHRAQHDPTLTLKRMPLPAWAQPIAAEGLNGRASLYHLLCALSGEPHLAHDPRVFDLLVFSCAIITCQSSWHPMTLGRTESDRGPSHVEIADVRRTGKEAMTWLIEQLPTRCFAQEYEKTIAVTKNIRYRQRDLMPGEKKDFEI